MTDDDLQSLVEDHTNFDFSFDDWKSPKLQPPSARDLGVSWFLQMSESEPEPRRKNVYRLLGRLTNCSFEPVKEPKDPFRVGVELSEELSRRLYDSAPKIDFPPLRARLHDIAHLRLRGKVKRDSAIKAAESYLNPKAYRDGEDQNFKIHFCCWELKALLRAFFLARQFGPVDLCQRAEALFNSRKLSGQETLETAGHRVHLLEGLLLLKLQPPEQLRSDIQFELDSDKSEKPFPRSHFLELLTRIEASHSGGQSRPEYKEAVRRQAEELIRSSQNPALNSIQKVYRLKEAAKLYHQIEDSDGHEKCVRLLGDVQPEMLEELREVSAEIEVEFDFRDVIEDYVVKDSKDWLDAHQRLSAFVDTSLLSIHLGSQADSDVQVQVVSQWRLNKKGETIADNPAGTITPAGDYVRLRLGILAMQLAWAQYRLLGLLGPLERQHVLELVEHSDFCAPHHTHGWARGLYHGWGGDWAVSMGTLLPLIEDGLREALIKAGAIPFKMSYSKNRDTEKLEVIQHKYLLNNLLFEPFASFMPAHLVAAFRSVLSGSNGFNWRNLVCHGLVGDEELSSPPSILTWALALVVCFLPYDFANRAYDSAHQGLDP